MKSTVLAGTLAASLVSTLHAEVFVLGTSWRERSLVTEDGMIERKMRNNAAPRGYIIVEQTAGVTTCAFIQYDTKEKTYTITTGLTNFTADIVDDQTGTSSRIFGHSLVPVETAEVTNPTMSFSGSTHEGNMPRRVAYDRAVFQSGDSTEVAGPNVIKGGDMKRSILVGSGTNVEVSPSTTTQALAIAELKSRFFRPEDGWTQGAVAPVILTDLAANTPRAGFVTADLSVTLNSDVFPNPPTFQWLKGASPGPYTTVGTSPTFTIPAGPAGDGVYHAVISTAAGSVTTAFTTAPPATTVTLAFVAPTPASPAAVAVSVPFAGSAVLTPTTNAAAFPQITSYTWAKQNTATPPAFVDILPANGGKQPTYTVIGNNLNGAINGPGVYRVTITNGTTTLTATYTVTGT